MSQGSPNRRLSLVNRVMRAMLLLGLLLGGTSPLAAQWQIFAEQLPKPGSWATYQMETTREGRVTATDEVRLTVRPGREIGGQALVWFSIEPVGWLGSRERGPLRLLVRPDMDRASAGRLVENAAEIVFANPVKGSYHMTREDISWVSDWANLRYTSELTPAEPATEMIPLAAGRPVVCDRIQMRATTFTDPPMVSGQLLEFSGTIWRHAPTPFGVVRAEWLEKTTRGSKIREETKRLLLTASGWEPPTPEPVDRGRAFSVWRLIFNR